jgi:hypothetical protein
MRNTLYRPAGMRKVLWPAVARALSQTNRKPIEMKRVTEDGKLWVMPANAYNPNK